MSAKAAIARLRAYKPPPFSTWDHLPLSRRAAVLVLLFADRRGDLRVVLTMRAATLRNYSGMVLFHILCREILSISRPSCISWRQGGYPRRNAIRNCQTRSIRRNRPPKRRLQDPPTFPNRASLPTPLQPS
jgi:hypothetical protein